MASNVDRRPSPRAGHTVEAVGKVQENKPILALIVVLRLVRQPRLRYCSSRSKCRRPDANRASRLSSRFRLVIRTRPEHSERLTWCGGPTIVHIIVATLPSPGNPRGPFFVRTRPFSLPRGNVQGVRS